MRMLCIVASVLSLALVACGDDDAPSDGGTDGGGGTNAAGKGGKGGAGGSRAGTGGGKGAAGASGSSAGKGGSGGSGGASSGLMQNITIKFKAKLGSADFACGTSVGGQGSTNASVQPLDFRMYVQDVKLIADDGQEVAVQLDTRSPWQTKDVAMLDFENGTGLCSGDTATNTEITGTVPKGSYKGIVFSNGVPDALNHADPVTLPAPLAGGALTWGWLLGYRFIKVEVASMIEDAEVSGGLFHLGSTGCTNTSLDDGGVDYEAPPSITCSNPNRNVVRLSNYAVGTSVIIADVGTLFSKTDLKQVSECHSGGAACGPIFESAGVNFDTGASSSGQTFYTLE